MIVCLSASHKKVKLPMLESLSISNENEAMKCICSEGLAKESLLLQTCHRVELYCVIEDSAKEYNVRRILKFWSSQSRISFDILNDVVELLQGKEALAHLFFLAGGLESMVVGEDQILGQMRTAYVKAKENGTVGLVLGKVWMRAINTGRRVRTETRINEGSVSISSAAVDLAVKELGNLKSVNALVIGAGEAGSIAAETLRRRGAKTILIANRTHKRGLELASKVSGKAIEFSHIYEAISEADLVIAAISTEKPVLKASQMKKILSRRSHSKRLYAIDISQPRAIEEKAGLLPEVTLRNIDDLKRIVEENIRNRQAESEKVQRIILAELERVEQQLARFLIEPIISKIYKKIEDIRRKELSRAIRKMKESNREKLSIMDRFSKELIERILQIPIEQIREASLNNDTTLLLSAKKLFNVKPEEGEESD